MCSAGSSISLYMINDHASDTFCSFFKNDIKSDLSILVAKKKKKQYRSVHFCRFTGLQRGINRVFEILDDDL